jgi:hypothetical protein
MPELNEHQFSARPVYSGPGLAEQQPNGWMTHAISENGSLTGEEPGMQWNRYTALVPGHQLLRFREYDREGSQGFSNSQENIRGIAKDLSAQGVKGLREPVSLEYDHENNWGVVTEGNHRLAAAVQAGLTHIPVTIHARADHSTNKKNGVGAPLHMDTRIRHEGHGYHPSILHPGNFQEFEGAR